MRLVLCLTLAVLTAVLIYACGETEEATQSESPGATTPAASGSATPTASPGGSATAEPDSSEITVVNLLEIPEGVQPSESIAVESLAKWEPGRPWFSPDGSRFWASTPDGLVVGTADRSEERIIEPDAFFAAWAPDSERLAVSIGREAYGNQEPVAIYLMAPDGSERVQIGDTEAPLRIQWLSTGELLYVQDSELHAYDTSTGEDSGIAGVAVDNDPHNIYLASPDGQCIAVLFDRAMTVADRSSGAEVALSSTVEARGASPLGWSDDSRLLIYSYITGFRIPEIAAYDRVTGTSTILVTGKERGTFGGMQLVGDGGWMVFGFYPAGPVIEVAARYQAINVYTGETAGLFAGGLGLVRLSPDGTALGVLRTDPLYAEGERGFLVARISW